MDSFGDGSTRLDSDPLTKLLLDVDTGIDDAVALTSAIADPTAEIVGICCTAGNTTTAHVAQNTLAWLDLCRAEPVPVALGAATPLAVPLVTTPETHGPTGLGWAKLETSSRALAESDAADLWVNTVRTFPGQVTGVLTGPATNLALAIERDAELPQLLGRLVVMGGSFHHRGNTTAVAEWNVSVDPEAAQAVFEAFSAVPPERRPIVCGLNVTEQIELRADHVLRIAHLAGSTPVEQLRPDQPPGLRSSASNPLIAALYDALRFYFEFHRDYDRIWACHLHDPFTVAVALDDRWAQLRPARVDVELAGTITRAATIADFDLDRSRPNADIVVATQPEAFLDHLVTRLASLATRLEHNR